MVTEVDATLTLRDRTVAITAERRHAEQAGLFTARGATVVSAPTMHTIDLSTDAVLRRHTESVIADPPDILVATTGFGMRLWFDAAASWGLLDRLLAALASTSAIARGPKARSALRQRDLDVAWQAPNESMDEVVAHLTARPDVASASVVVQLFDDADHPSSAALGAHVADLRLVTVYRWEPPLDPAPVHDLIDAIIAGQVDAVTFTSQPAVRFLVDLAGDRAAELVAACNDGRCLPVCIGPVCARAGDDVGITTMVWPDPYRLVPMVKLVEQELAAPT